MKTEVAIDDRGEWIALNDSRGMTLALVQKMADGKWIARANDSGGMGVNHSINICPHAAAREAKFFGFHSANVHAEMAELERWLQHDHPARCKH